MGLPNALTQKNLMVDAEDDYVGIDEFDVFVEDGADFENLEASHVMLSCPVVDLAVTRPL